MYVIHRNTSRNRVIVMVDGQQHLQSDEFWEDFKEAAHFAKCARPHFDVLFDHTLKPILPQDSTKRGEAMALWCLENGLRKSANIVPSTLMRMQLQRITARNPQFAYFGTREDGENWLDEDSLAKAP